MIRFRRMTPLKGMILGAAVGVLATVIHAGTTVIDPINGDLLSVDTVVDIVDPTVQGVRLLVQKATTGEITEETIPSTYDQILDQEPVISLKPSGGVVVVWSRQEGNDFDLALARRGPGGGWTPHDILTSSPKNDTRPRLHVDPTETAHILWWGNDVGGPIYFQSFDVPTAQTLGPRHTPFDDGTSPGRKRIGTGASGPDQGGMDDPGVVTVTDLSVASAIPCDANPTAVPDHGVVMSCGQPAVYQVTDCRLAISTFDGSAWDLFVSNVTNVDLSTTPVRQMVQSLAEARCN